jgi:hypothetical protein
LVFFFYFIEEGGEMRGGERGRERERERVNVEKAVVGEPLREKEGGEEGENIKDLEKKKKNSSLTGQYRDGGPRLPVPDPQRLVVTRGQDPGTRRVELHRPDVVQVAQKREQAAPQLVRPDLDAVVVAARREEWLRGVEVDAADWAVVLVEAVDEGAHAVVPELVMLRFGVNGGGGGVSARKRGEEVRWSRSRGAIEKSLLFSRESFSLSSFSPSLALFLSFPR